MLRQVLLLLSILLCSTSCGGALDQFGLTERRVQRQVNETLEDLARRELAHYPEAASRLGLSLDRAGFDYRGQLNDYSQAGFETQRLLRLDIYKTLMELPLPRPGSAARTNLEILRAVYERTLYIEGRGRGRVRLGYARPYALDQLSGIYLDGPDFLAQQHALRSPDDAAAYLRRFAELPAAIHGEKRRLLGDAKLNTVPPRRILDLVQQNISALTEGPVEEMELVQTFEGLLTGVVDLSASQRQNYRRQAIEIIIQEILPAYAALSEAITGLHENAPEELGLWAQFEGEDYYADLLRHHSGTDLTPDQVFALGETMVTRLSAQIAQELDRAGLLSEDPVGLRLATLSTSEAQAFNTDPEIARAEILDQLEAEIRRAQAVMSRIVDRPPSIPIDVRPVPDLRQLSGASAYYEVASIEGAPLGIFFINLKDPSDWSRFALPTLAYHEGLPGHHLETSTLLEDNEAALLRRLVWLPSYGEGWALYAEDLADELGFYEDRPLARIGYLQSLLFRSARLVVDVGIHAKRWSREEAISYLVDTTGQPRAMMEREVDRYAVWPGQSASYMIGRDQIVRLRRRAEAVLGNQFNLADFHEVILQGGPRPPDLMEADVDRWLAEFLG